MVKVDDLTAGLASQGTVISEDALRSDAVEKKI